MITMAALLWLKTRFAEAPERLRVRPPVLVVIRSVKPTMPRDGYFGGNGYLPKQPLSCFYYGFAR